MWNAWRDGVSRAARAPGLVAAVWVAVALFAWPIAMSSRFDLSVALDSPDRPESTSRVLGALREQTLARGQEFGGGVAQLVADAGAFTDYESRWMVSLTASYPFIAIWTLLSGGIIDRLARDRPTRAYGVGAVSAAFFFRFLRLGVMMAAVYALAFAVAGRTPTVLAAILAACNLVFDYAQVRAVVEDRRSMVVALGAAVSFIRRNIVATLGVYALDWSILAAVTAGYVALGPGSAFRFGPGSPVWWTVLWWIGMNQLYVIARIWTRAVFWSSAAALFQRRLAHAGYVARPLPVWPESPSAEALGNLEAKN